MSWAETAMRRLDEAGCRIGAARRRVIDLLATEPCAVTAPEINRRLGSVGRASVYRTLDQLDRLHLIQQVAIGADAVGFERMDPDQHHHHLVCERCGRLSPFVSTALEEAIESVGRTSEFEVAAHDVVLRGTCASCVGDA